MAASEIYLCILVPDYPFSSLLHFFPIMLLPHLKNETFFSQAVRHMPLILSHRRQSQADLGVYEASLVYKVNFRTDKAIQRYPALKNQNPAQTKPNQSS